MNFYKHHIGDYGQATAHLSFIEDAAYSRLLRKYYAEEKPISGGMPSIQRLLGARSRAECEAIKTVLEEFFTLEDDGCWHNKRADEDIAQYQAQADNNRRIASEREAKRRARRAAIDEAAHYESCNESCDDSLEDRAPNQNQNQNQEPDIPLGPSVIPSPAKVETRARSVAIDACKRMESAGCSNTNPSDSELLIALEQGVTSEELEDAARTTARAGLAQSNPFHYAIKMASNHRLSLCERIRHTADEAQWADDQGQDTGEVAKTGKAHQPRGTHRRPIDGECTNLSGETP